MKLVDILARELKEWPVGLLWAVQDAYSKHERTVWFGAGERPVFERGDWTVSCVLKPLETKSLASDYDTAIVTRADWQAAVEALNKPSPPAWAGVGDPPSGTVCELRHVSAETGWGKAVIAFASRNVIVWDWDGEPAINGLCTAYRHAVEVRPVRTPEQIAADERTKDIDELVKVTCINRGEAARIYDAGYRKQEAP